MIQHTFKHDGASITVRAQNGWDEINTISWQAKLRQSGVDIESLEPGAIAARELINCVTQTVSVDGSLPIQLPRVGITGADFVRAVDDFMNCGKLYQAYREALRTVNTPPNEPELLPPEKVTEQAVTEAKKKAV